MSGLTLLPGECAREYGSKFAITSYSLFLTLSLSCTSAFSCDTTKKDDYNQTPDVMVYVPMFPQSHMQSWGAGFLEVVTSRVCG